jgi:multidrug resistance efflux pump
MNYDHATLLRMARTGVVVFVAALLGFALWWHYMRSPWTRDGRVRAEEVDVAAEISGKVVTLPLADNQFVSKGDILFQVDPRDYQLALAEAEATLQSRQLAMTIQNEESARRKGLGAQAVSTEEIQSSENSAAVATAAYQQAVAARDTAKLNLERTTVVSPVNGYVTNLHLRVGDYVTPGQTKLSIVDSDSFWVAGYFEETKLPRIHLGDEARIKLMGVGPDVMGHVESFSRGIADENAGGVGTGLANVDPIFTWVRLAQRIPIRIHIDKVPKDVKIVAGQTCTIVLHAGHHPPSADPPAQGQTQAQASSQ